MNLTRLKDFRHAIYVCFGRGKDALFNTVDALLTEVRAQSFPEFSLSPTTIGVLHTLTYSTMIGP
jgi:hypothetical protein